MNGYYGYGYAHPYYYPSVGAWGHVGQEPPPAWVPSLELQVRALVKLLVAKGTITEDELIRTEVQLQWPGRAPSVGAWGHVGQEPPPAWVPSLELQVRALAKLLVAKGLFTEDELIRTEHRLQWPR